MEQFRVEGPTQLNGEVKISGAKNAVLPILFASILAEEPIELQNVPQLKDVKHRNQDIKRIGSERDT